MERYVAYRTLNTSQGTSQGVLRVIRVADRVGWIKHAQEHLAENRNAE